MTERYIVTKRHGSSDHAGGAFSAAVIPRGIDRRIADLDTGWLVDADREAAARWESVGWRVTPVPHARYLRLCSHVIDTVEGVEPPMPREFARALGRAPQIPESKHHLVQLPGPIQESWLTILAECGANVLEAVAPHAYLVRMEQAVAAVVRTLPFVQWTGPLRPHYKVDPALLTDGDPGADNGLGRIIADDIAVYPDCDVDNLAAAIGAAGGKVERIDDPGHDIYRSVLAQLPRSALPIIAARDDVRWIVALRQMIPTDERSCQIAFGDLDGAPAPDTAPNRGYAANLSGAAPDVLGVDGSGVTVAICDGGVSTNDPNTMHPDLAGRFAFAVDAVGKPWLWPSIDDHGTHIAGIVAGNAATGQIDPQGFLLGQGVAPGATIGSVVNCIPNPAYPADRDKDINGHNVGHLIATSAANNSVVANVSLKTWDFEYTGEARRIDLGVRNAGSTPGFPIPMVVVKSAGNSGHETTTKGDYHIEGLLKITNSKNAIVVGNQISYRPDENPVNDIRGINDSSSRGPAEDRRIMPTLIAPGTGIVSTGLAGRSNRYQDTAGTVHPEYLIWGGTSMAAPHVAGIAALVIEWWRRTRNGRTPSPALIKALLVATTESAQGGYSNSGPLGYEPNNDVGFGRVCLANALLQHPASNRGAKIFVDQRHAFTASGQDYVMRVAVSDPSLPLRVALAWTDVAGAVGANPAIVNNLNLEVYPVGSLSGVVYRGNVMANGFSVLGGNPDMLNNIELVAIENPSGEYDITVHANNIAASAHPGVNTPWQDFALVIDNAEASRTANAVDVVLAVDRSDSMKWAGYTDVTLQTSRQFVDLLAAGDAVGVIGFGTTVDRQYPASGPVAPVTDQNMRGAVKSAIDSISFSGCTFMGGAIQQAASMMPARIDRQRSIVLLSDGYDNHGCTRGNVTAKDAAKAVPTGLSIYSCAMGPASDQELLAELASTTGGRYFYMPTIDDLFEIYNYIRGRVVDDGIIVNQTSTASASRVSAWVDGCAESVLLTVAWHDRTLHYVARDARANDEISIQLMSPDGRWLPRSGAEFLRHVGTGYVSFAIDDPRPGEWTIAVSTAREAHTRYTVGGFVRSALKMQVNAPAVIAPGQSLMISTTIGVDGRPVTGATVDTRFTAPRASIRDVIGRYTDDLTRIQIPVPYEGDPPPNRQVLDIVKLAMLRDELIRDRGEDILAPLVHRLRSQEMSSAVAGKTYSPEPSQFRRTAGRPLPEVRGGVAMEMGDATAVGTGGFPFDDSIFGSPEPGKHVGGTRVGVIVDDRVVTRPPILGIYIGRFADTHVPGSYSAVVTASGHSPTCGTRFVRQDMVSVVASNTNGI